MTERSGCAPAWAHDQRLIELRRPQPPHDPDRLADRLAITEVVHCYGWGFDERREDVLGDLFVGDGVWRGSIAGSEELGPYHGREAIVGFLSDFWQGLDDQRRHNFGNVLVTEQSDETATALAYLLLTAASGRDITVVTTGLYRFSMARRDRTWRMTELYAGFDVPF